MKTILIVDDQAGIRLLLEQLFTKENFNVLSAENGEQALQLAATTNIDIVLLDMQMPGMGGIAVLKKLQSTQPNLPVIMMSAYEETELIESVYRLGAKKYFIKPFDVFEVRDTVVALFEP